TGSQGEVDGYVGLPLLGVVLFTMWRHWRVPIVRFTGIFAAAIAVLSVGMRPHFEGRSLPLPLPWALVQDLPIFEHVVPWRLALFTFLLVGLLASVFFDRLDLKVRWQKFAGAGALAAIIGTLFPALPYLATPADIPPFFGSNAVDRIAKGSVALV